MVEAKKVKQPKPLDESETVKGQMSIPQSARVKMPKKKEEEKKDDVQGSMMEALDEILSEIKIDEDDDKASDGGKRRRARNQYKSKTYAKRKSTRKIQKAARRKNRK